MIKTTQLPSTHAVEVATSAPGLARTRAHTGNASINLSASITALIEKTNAVEQARGEAEPASRLFDELLREAIRDPDTVLHTLTYGHAQAYTSVCHHAVPEIVERLTQKHEQRLTSAQGQNVWEPMAEPSQEAPLDRLLTSPWDPTFSLSDLTPAPEAQVSESAEYLPPQDQESPMENPFATGDSALITRLVVSLMASDDGQVAWPLLAEPLVFTGPNSPAAGASE